MNTLTPPIDLKGYFYPVVSVKANPNALSEDGECTISHTVTREVKVAKHPDQSEERAYNVWLKVTNEEEKDEDSICDYEFTVEAVGTFLVAEDFPADPEEMVERNGAAILFSSVREMLYTLTSRGPYDPICLPTVSFIPAPENED